MEIKINGARTQQLWGKDLTALFCTEKLTEDQSKAGRPGATPFLPA